jgi:atypical dual specificity phosphatase
MRILQVVKMSLLSEDNFRWVIRGKLAGSHSPTVKELAKYKSMGFNAIVCLQEDVEKRPLWESLTDYDRRKYSAKDALKAGLTPIHIPVEDMKPPTKKHFDEFVQFCDHKDRVTVVHCYAGIGRTGCMLAAYLGVKHELTGEATIEAIRAIWPVYIQTNEQKQGVIDYINKRK